MDAVKHKKHLTVAPFECAWREDLRFREAGRGCIAFEAFAHNDVTLVFREQVGSQRYHYRMDNSPNYTVVIGSHRNRRLKIEVDGRTVVDVAGVGLCSSTEFQAYWISIYDGLICIGKGRHPFHDLVYQWLDPNPNRNVQYVGLSSWDKHVRYRNINVFSLATHCSTPARICYKDLEEYEYIDDEHGDLVDSYDGCGLANFLEKWDFSDIIFVVGDDNKVVPAHKVILLASGDFSFFSDVENTIDLHSYSYPVVHAFLEFIYSGRTQVMESQLCSLQDLGLKFQVASLVKQCEELICQFKTGKKMSECAKVDVINGIFPFGLPVYTPKLKQFLVTGDYSDLNIYAEGHGLIARSHKIILSSWSITFAKMFTNGMIESNSSDIFLKDISAEAFLAVLQFLYSGELVSETTDLVSLLIPMLILADQYGITCLERECCNFLKENLTEDSVSSVLQVVSSIGSCKLLEETCKRNFAMHFDYCTTATPEFVLLDETTFKSILQHSDLTVMSEEKVLNAILLWCMQASDIFGWAMIDDLLVSSTEDELFMERISSVDALLPFVRFFLMPMPLLQKLKLCRLASLFPLFKQLVMEAISFLDGELTIPEINNNLRFQHRRSSFKELQYICDGDNNGVIYFTGTSYGEHQWVNPVLSKKITVAASSPASRYTDPKSLVSRTYQATSFAGPRIEDGKNRAWWMIDLGWDHQLMCNYYTLRQDGSNKYPRSWALQGSVANKDWVDLRVHENDQMICQPGQFASWSVHGPNTLLPFRFFRVVLLGPTTGESSLWNLCICSIELYGYFH